MQGQCTLQVRACEKLKALVALVNAPFAPTAPTASWTYPAYQLLVVV
jgi:hypothetical protein